MNDLALLESINPDLLATALKSVDLSDPEERVWRIDHSPSGFRQLIGDLNASAQVRARAIPRIAVKILRGLSMIAIILAPVLAVIFLALLILSAITSIFWLLSKFLPPPVFMVYGLFLMFYAFRFLWRASLPYRSEVKGYFRDARIDSLYAGSTRSSLQQSGLVGLVNLYVALISFIWSASETSFSGNTGVLVAWLKLDLDIVLDAVLFGFPVAIWGPFSSIEPQGIVGNLLMSLLKLTVVVGVVAESFRLIERRFQRSSIFVGTTRELADHLIVGFNQEVEGVRVTPLAAVAQAHADQIPAVYFFCTRLGEPMGDRHIRKRARVAAAGWLAAERAREELAADASKE